MDDTPTPPPKNGDSPAYAAMAQAVQANLTDLLAPFNAAASAEQLLKKSSLEVFLQDFISHADRFAESCCQQFARIIREHAVNPEVLGKPTVVLAREIRADVFAGMDGILTSYIEELAQIGMNLKSISNELRSSGGLMDAAMKGAAVGQVAGGLGGSGKTLGGINALLSAGVEAERQAGLMQQKTELLRRAEVLAIPKIALFLEQVASLPERLLDYGCARCLGAQVSLVRQQAAWESVVGAVAQDLKVAVNIVLALPEAQKRMQLERLIQAGAVEEQKRQREELESLKKNPTEGTILLVISIGLVVWSFRSCSATSASEGDLFWALILLVSAVFAFVSGVRKFSDRTPKGPISTVPPKHDKIRL